MATARYQRFPMATLVKCEVLILDDLLMLLEIIQERYDRKSTIITSQLPVKSWHDAMQDPTLADAILDRLVHNAYKIEMTGSGDSMRKRQRPLDHQAVTISRPPVGITPEQRPASAEYAACLPLSTITNNYVIYLDQSTPHHRYVLNGTQLSFCYNSA